MADEVLTPDDYLRHAEQNEHFADFLIEEVLNKRANFSEWGLVVIFYAALHYTKAAILHKHWCIASGHIGHTDEKGRNDPGHNDYVSRFFPPELAALYTDLYEMSREARYEDFFRQPDSSFAEVKRQRGALGKIKEASLAKLAEERDDLSSL